MLNQKNLNLDLSFIANEDRLLLCIRSDKEPLEFWLTRRMTLFLIKVWSTKLTEIDLPVIDTFVDINVKRDIKQEHLLSLEFDGPTDTLNSKSKLKNVMLVAEMTILVTHIESVLALKTIKSESLITMTRKESHAFLEMLVRKVEIANWTDSVKLPLWLKSDKTLINKID